MSRGPVRVLAVAGNLLLLSCMASLGAATQADAQAVEGPLSPAGRLGIGLSGHFWTHDARFGLRREDGRLVEATEPLGFDLSRPAAGTELLPGLTPLQESVRSALDDPAVRVSVGRTRARIRATRITLPFRVDLGVTDWLSVGVNVPFVKQRSEVAFLLDADSATANLGLNPRLESPAQVAGFSESMGAAIDALQARSDARCDGRDATAVQCAEIAAALEQARSLRDALSEAYASEGLFPFRGSTAGRILTGRLETLANRFSDHGVTGLPSSLPLAEGPLDEESFAAYLTDPKLGMDGSALDTWQSVWELGDVELHGAVRILEKARAPDPASVWDRTTVLLGAGGLVRLGTGTPDQPDHFTDLGSGDGQTDVEARLFGDLALGGVGLWADARYGIQLEGTRIRRVAPPEVVLPPAGYARQLTWTPGDYRSLEVAPRYHLTPELAVAGRYRFYRKGADRYALVSGDDTPPDEPLPGVDPADLEAETEATLHQVGIGLVYSTLRAARRDLAGRPLEIHVRYRVSSAGSGGLTPKASSVRLGLRLFWSLWGGQGDG